MSRERVGFAATWAMAVGGRVGGGIFGRDLGNVAEFLPWVSRTLGGFVLLALTLVDLRGACDASGVGIVTVWGKLAAPGVLLLLAFGTRPLLLRSVRSRD